MTSYKLVTSPQPFYFHLMIPSTDLVMRHSVTPIEVAILEYLNKTHNSSEVKVWKNKNEKNGLFLSYALFIFKFSLKKLSSWQKISNFMSALLTGQPYGDCSILHSIDILNLYAVTAALWYIDMSVSQSTETDCLVGDCVVKSL